MSHFLRTNSVPLERSLNPRGLIEHSHGIDRNIILGDWKGQMRKGFLCSQIKRFNLRQQQNTRVLDITVGMIPIIFPLEKRYRQDGMILTLITSEERHFSGKGALVVFLFVCLFVCFLSSQININFWYFPMYPG